MRTESLDSLKQLRDVLNKAIAAIESGREVEIDIKLPGEYGGTWQEFDLGPHREFRCIITPREVWINENMDGSLRLVAMRTRTEAQASASPGHDPIRFIEAPFQEQP